MAGGDVAQLVEHLVCNQEVVGSIPIVSTNSSGSRERMIKRTAFLAGLVVGERERVFFDNEGW